MARFIFSLQAVLRHRRRMERERQREVADIQRQVVAVEAELQRLDQAVSASNDELRAHHLQGAINLSYLAAQRRYVLSLRDQGAEQLAKLVQLRQVLLEAQQRLARAARDRKILEKLREKRLAAWMAARLKQEADQLDEVGVQGAFAALQLSPGDSDAR